MTYPKVPRTSPSLSLNSTFLLKSEASSSLLKRRSSILRSLSGFILIYLEFILYSYK